jgi:toxin ParE1/3/4
VAKPEYRLTPRAERDLEDIWRYTTKRWSADQAETYVVGA